jgi:hypothetical protein
MGKVRLAARKPLAAWALTGSALVVLAAALVLVGLNVMNQMGPRWQNPRTRALVDAVYACL